MRQCLSCDGDVRLSRMSVHAAESPHSGLDRQNQKLLLVIGIRYFERHCRWRRHTQLTLLWLEAKQPH